MWSSSALGESQALPVEDRLCIASAFSPARCLRHLEPFLQRWARCGVCCLQGIFSTRGVHERTAVHISGAEHAPTGQHHKLLACVPVCLPARTCSMHVQQ